MKLAYHSHIPAFEKDGEIYTTGYQAIFITELARNFQSISCLLHTPLQTELNQCTVPVEVKHVKFVGLGPHDSVPRRTMRVLNIIKKIKDNYSDFDVLLIRGPSPLLPFIAGSLRGKPITFLLVASYLEKPAVRQGNRLKNLLIDLWSRWNENAQKRQLKGRLVLANSKKLIDEYMNNQPPPIEVSTSIIRKSDITYRYTACQKSKIQLIYSGRITREKGLFEILAAMKQLVDKGYDIEWVIVGMAENNTLEKLLADAEFLGLGGKVIYEGYKNSGSELLAVYRTADIFVLSSLFSFEGFPRTIWEAFSQGVPVVATNVGSIPLTLQNGKQALLSEPGDIDAFANNIKQIIDDQNLRLGLIIEGYEIVQNYTIEAQTLKLADEVKNYVNSL